MYYSMTQPQNFVLCCQSNIKSVNWVYTRSTFKRIFLPRKNKCIKNIVVGNSTLPLFHLIIRPTTRWQTNLTPVRSVSVKFLADVLWEPEHKVWTVKYGRFRSHVIKRKKSASRRLVMKIALLQILPLYCGVETIFLWWHSLLQQKKQMPFVFVILSLLQKQMKTSACHCFNLQTSTY